MVITRLLDELMVNQILCKAWSPRSQTLLYIYIYIYAPLPGLSPLAKELTAATLVMQSSFNELSSLLSDSAKCKQTKADTNAL